MHAASHRKLILPGWWHCLLAAALADSPIRASAALETGCQIEGLGSSDIVLSDLFVFLSRDMADYETVLTYRHSDHWIDYRPPEDGFIGQANDRHSSTDALRLATQGPFGDGFLWLAEAGGYMGFPDYQALWLDEYYNQLFDGYTGYEETDPWGLDGMVGLRWNYINASAFAQVAFFGARQRVSPHWEPVIGAGLQSTDTTIDSFGTRFELENVLSRRFRSNNRLTVVENSVTQARWSLESQNHYALSDCVVLKGTLGGSLENPDFHAFWTTAAAEWDYQRKWFTGIQLRYYSDSGELIESNPYGVEAPPAEAFGILATLRWIGGSQQASAGIGPYWTRYNDEQGTSPVGELYSDRNWLWFQATWNCQF